MSGGGGKGGSKKTETTIPEWVRAPADRNLRRAEQVQQLKYMPYTGGQVAALTPTQEAAMNNNISTAQAFGLLDPNSTLTATSGMPTPTTYANGMKGYGSIGLYDQALKELTARDPANMAAYNNLFGNTVPANVARGGGGGRGGGGASPSRPRGLTEQQQYEQKMADVYANVRVGTDANGKPVYGYTGQDNQSRAGSRSPNYVNNTVVKVAPPYKQSSSAKLLGGTTKNYFGGKRVTGGR